MHQEEIIPQSTTSKEADRSMLTEADRQPSGPSLNARVLASKVRAPAGTDTGFELLLAAHVQNEQALR
jgi:hypothetical protein